MVRSTGTRLVQNPFTATTLGQGGTSFVVGQASSATCVRRNTPATSLGTFIPLQNQNSASEESVSLIVQLGTTVLATSTSQMLEPNSTVTISKSAPAGNPTSSTGRNVNVNYPQGVNHIKGGVKVQQHTHHPQVIRRPTTNIVANSNIKNSINCSMQQLYVQQQVVQPQQSLSVKQSHILAKSVADTQPSADEQRLEHAEVPNLGEENLREVGITNFVSNVSVPHQFHTEERRMEIVKFVLQDHNYGAPPPASPPISPSHHGKLTSGATGATSTLGPNSYTPCGAVYQYGTGLLTLRDVSNNDDDANSVISSNTGREVEPEGEETETAPEGEGDDEDSVTRCICDFEHDDGYMICCDKCFVWQHVDCMGIDRSNIPDEYMCERCQPRRVDRQHARTLQLRKREELLNTDSSSDSSSSSTDTDGGVINTAPTMASKKRAVSNTVNKRKGELASTNKKNVTNSNNLANITKQQRQRRESSRDQSQTTPSAVTATQRRASMGQSRKKETNRATTENKRTPARRKSKGRTSEDETQDSWDRSVYNSGTMLQLRQWIDSYEEAVTNHYSPELRARISSIKVNGIHSDLKAGNLHSVASGATKCRVSQLAPGVRILVSTTLISANQPVIELRGKYMLSTQHRPPTLTVINNKRTRPPPGPFIFFYRLPKDGTEVCVDTRTYGNDARFIRRSCKPNAEIRHRIEKGILHLYVVTVSTIEKNSEITINHDGTQDASALVNSSGSPHQFICACGNPKECTALNRRNGIHEPTDRERRRRGRRTTSSEEGDALTVPSQQHQDNQNSGDRQTLINTSNADNLPLRRSSTTVRSPKIPHEQLEQQQQQQQQQQQKQQQQQQKIESGDHDHTVSDSVPGQQDKKRKLTREERKMEAIMKAFERLEKAEQRRQENQAKQAHRKDHQHEATNSGTPKKESFLDTKKVLGEAKDDGLRCNVPSVTTRSSAADRQRRKRRKGRGRTSSTSQHPPPPQRRRTRLNSGDSDMTSADEAVGMSSNMGLLHSSQPSHINSEGNHQSSPVSAAAGLLLALAGGNTPQPQQNSVPSYQHTPPHLDRLPRCTTPQAQGGVNPTLFCDNANSSGSGSSQGSTPPTPLSSACLLVAAAVGPLAPGFKFPKTKKVLMNEWLNKSPELPSVPSSTIPVPLTSPILLRPNDLPLNPTDLILNPQVADSYGYSSHPSPTKSLATLAQAANRVALGSSTSPTPHSSRANLGSKGAPSAPGGGVGSAKKRWLRQAISEECDSPTTNSCASPNSRTGSPPCPDYVTPLKKRRLARESLSSEQSFTPPTTPTMLADQQLSSSSPPTQKCVQYDVTGMNLVGCEEDETIASPGDDEPPLINDGEYEDREERCEGGFDGHGSPVNDCFRRQGDVRNMTVTDYSAQSILLKGDESEGIIRDRSTNGGLLIRRDVDQPQCDDTDMEEKEKDETEEHVQPRESSIYDDANDDDDDDEEEEEETRTSPVPDIESQGSLRRQVADVKLELSVNSSEETEEEGCRGFEDQDDSGEHEDGSNQGCEVTVGSETETLNVSKTKILNGKRTVKNVNVKEQDSGSIDGIGSLEKVVLKSSFQRCGTTVTEVSAGSNLYEKMPEMALPEMESGFANSCKREMLVELPDTSLKQPQVSRGETISSTQTIVVSSATAEPAKRKLSISEYRQRKQRNSSTEFNSGGVEGDGGTRNSSVCEGSRGRTDSTSSSSSSVSSDDDVPNACASLTNKNLLLDSSPALSALPLFLHTDTSDDKRGVGEDTYMRWNSAPTLVERQRENLTERLRREFGLFLSDDEEQERARKQSLVQEVKDGKKKAPPPPPPPPLPPPESTTTSPTLVSSTQHLITMYSSAPKLGQANSPLSPVYPSVLVPGNSVPVGTPVNYISGSGNPGYASANSNLPPSNRQSLSGQGYNLYSLTTALKTQTYGSFPASLGGKGLPNSTVTAMKSSGIPPSSVTAVYQSSIVNSGSCKATQKYLLTTTPPPPPPLPPPPPPPLPLPSTGNTQFVMPGPYGTASSNLSPQTVMIVGPGRGVSSNGTFQGTTHFVSPPLPSGNHQTNSTNQQQTTAPASASSFFTVAAAKAYYPLPPPPPPPPRT